MKLLIIPMLLVLMGLLILYLAKQRICCYTSGDVEAVFIQEGFQPFAVQIF